MVDEEGEIGLPLYKDDHKNARLSNDRLRTEDCISDSLVLSVLMDDLIDSDAYANTTFA